MRNRPANPFPCTPILRLASRGLLVTMIGLAVGCRQPWYAAEGSAAAQTADVLSGSSQAERAIQSRAGTAGEPAPHARPDDPFELSKGESAEQQELTAITAELQALDDIDEATRQQILEDLRGADAAVLHHVRATLAYRRQVAQRQDSGADAAVSDAEIAADAEDIGQAFAEPARQPLTDETESATASLTPNALAALPLPEPGVGELPLAAETASPPRHSDSTPTSDSSETGVMTAVFERPVELERSTPPYGGETWQQLLEQAIARLEEQTATAPATSAEIGNHARLRLLQLVADDREAFRPIDGIPPNQQDFWAKQLFGLSVCLDEQTQPDVRRRASLAQHHFESAMQLLSEIAVLEVRNLTFCRSIRGYGIFEPELQPRFRAGDQVTLYAEVANYRSEQSPDGYRTMLSSSYEVLDENDRRVDAGEFPQVEDVCGSRRRDFHIQYGVNLPTRIYPGRYRLQITIEDVLSRKLGRSAVEFEIVDGSAPTSR